MITWRTKLKWRKKNQQKRFLKKKKNSNIVLPHQILIMIILTIQTDILNADLLRSLTFPFRGAQSARQVQHVRIVSRSLARYPLLTNHLSFKKSQ
jgi:hypothetical protein